MMPTRQIVWHRPADLGRMRPSNYLQLYMPTYRLEIEERFVSIIAPNEQAAYSFGQYLLRKHLREIGGGAWDTVTKLIQLEIVWPAWQRHFSRVFALATRQRAGLPRLMDDPTVERNSNGNLKAEAHWERNRLYNGLVAYRPDDENTASSVYFESVPQDLARFHSAMSGVSSSARSAYFLRAYWSNTLLPLYELYADIPANDLAILQSHNLLVSADKLPLTLLLRDLPRDCLARPVLQLGLPDAQRKARAGYVATIQEHQHNAELINLLHQEARTSGLVGFLPPKGFDWLSFQYLREQCKWGAITLEELIGPWIRDASIRKELQEVAELDH